MSIRNNSRPSEQKLVHSRTNFSTLEASFKFFLLIKFEFRQDKQIVPNLDYTK